MVCKKQTNNSQTFYIKVSTSAVYLYSVTMIQSILVRLNAIDVHLMTFRIADLISLLINDNQSFAAQKTLLLYFVPLYCTQP